MLAVLLATVAVAAAPPLTIHGDHGIAGVVVGRSTPATAVARFGPAARTVAHPPDQCIAVWPQLGLRLEFISLGYGPPCRKGVLLDARITGPRFRTERGLRVGGPAARIAQLYPRARRAADGVRLVTRHACAEVGGFAYGALVAQVAAGCVTSLRVRTMPCE